MKCEADIWLPGKAPPAVAALLNSPPANSSVDEINFVPSADNIVGYEVVRGADGEPLLVLGAAGESAPERSLLALLPILLLILGAIMLLLGPSSSAPNRFW